MSRQGGGGGACLGADCFRPTFLVLAALGLGATACSAALFRHVVAPRRGASLYHAMHAELHSYDEEVQERGGHAPAQGMRRRRGTGRGSASGSTGSP